MEALYVSRTRLRGLSLSLEYMFRDSTGVAWFSLCIISEQGRTVQCFKVLLVSRFKSQWLRACSWALWYSDHGVRGRTTLLSFVARSASPALRHPRLNQSCRYDPYILCLEFWAKRLFKHEFVDD